MQFSLVALFALAASVSAGPLRMKRQDTCSISTCLVDLAGTGVACASALAQVDLDPISDIGCIVSAAQNAVNFPPSCSGCVDSAKSTLEGLF